MIKSYQDTSKVEEIAKCKFKVPMENSPLNEQTKEYKGVFTKMVIAQCRGTQLKGMTISVVVPYFNP